MPDLIFNLQSWHLACYIAHGSWIVRCDLGIVPKMCRFITSYYVHYDDVCAVVSVLFRYASYG